MIKLPHSKASILIDGQFGSTGKGLMAGYLAVNNEIDLAVTNASANAGHTCVVNDRRYVCYHLPTAAVVSGCAAYLNAGAIIDPVVLEREIEETGFDPGRLMIHPRAAVIEDQDRIAEGDPWSSTTAIASTRHGVGHALSRKIMRKAQLAGDVPRLKQWIGALDLSRSLSHGQTVLIEVPQGLGLGLNYGLAYPYCTSREVSVSQALSDAGLHPYHLGLTVMTLRTFPIRVGNIVQDDRVVGWSGPWYADQDELDWGQDLQRQPELTTVTKRPRRIASFSMLAYDHAIRMIRPDRIFLNFVNYLKDGEAFNQLIDRMRIAQMPTHFGIGPSVDDIYPWDRLGEMARKLRWV